MGHGARQRTRLRALQRRVWGDGVYEQQVRRRTRRRQRLTAVVVTGIGGQLVLTAVGLVLISTAASAHTSTIDISCTQVEFVYQNFPNVTATAHESVVINGVESASRDITFQGPATTDIITIALGSGSNTVGATDHWAYNGSPQGSANASQTLTYCHSNSTTTTTCPSTTTSPSSSTTSTSTVPETSTSSASSTSVPETSTSTVPETSTSTSSSSTTTSTTETSTSTSSSSTTTSSTETSTSTSPSSTSTSTTSVPETSTSSSPSSTTTSTSSATSTTTIGPGTSTTIHELGSTTTTIGGSTTSTTASHRKLPFTGSSGLSLAAALGTLGIGILAVGVARLRRAVERS